jgi:membrane protein implicated in regulation of membrane protease activity
VEEWVLWVVAAGVLAAGEVITFGFFLGGVAIAALAAAVVALAGGGVELQLIAFIAASVASFGIVRPIAMRHVRMPPRSRTGTAALVGARALVLERVDVDGGTVKIGGEVWSARSFDEDAVMEAGARVEVMEIEGATALVSE